MAEDSQKERWNNRYQDKDPAAQTAAEVLAWHSHLLPREGRALDVASGLGGNAIHLAQQGLDAEAWDLSDLAVQALNRFADTSSLSLLARVRNVELSPPEPDSFDVIAVSRFLNRSLCRHLSAALRPSGLLFYQTFTQMKVRGSGPSNPEYLLGDGELLSLFSALQPVIYREERDLGDPDAGFRDQAMLVAYKK